MCGDWLWLPTPTHPAGPRDRPVPSPTRWPRPLPGGCCDPFGLLPSSPEGLSLAGSQLISFVARECITSCLQMLLNIPK